MDPIFHSSKNLNSTGGGPVPTFPLRLFRKKANVKLKLMFLDRCRRKHKNSVKTFSHASKTRRCRWPLKTSGKGLSGTLPRPEQLRKGRTHSSQSEASARMSFTSAPHVGKGAVPRAIELATNQTLTAQIFNQFRENTDFSEKYFTLDFRRNPGKDTKYHFQQTDQ
jgi:hypothetical protein